MRNIGKRKIEEFINTDMDEKIFFGYGDFGFDKESLISLKEYLEYLREVKLGFEKGAYPFVKSISEKNRWVESVIPSLLGLAVQGKNDPSIGVRLDREQGRYIMDVTCVPNIAASVRLPFRKRVIENCQEELFEIGKLADIYNSQVTDVYSLSDSFLITNDYNYSSISASRQFLFAVDRDTLIPSEYTPSIYTRYKDNYAQLSMDDRQKLLKKIMIKK